MKNRKAIEILKPLTECSVDDNGIGTFPMVSTPLQVEALELAIKALEEQDRPTGEWIIKAEDYYKAINERGGGVDENTPYFVDDIACPKCLAMFSTIDNETERFNYCPNCGAKMRGGQDE